MIGQSETFVTQIVGSGGWAVTRKIPVTRLQVTEDGAAPRIVELESEVVRVGSANTGNDVVLDDEAVSRFHFTLTWDQRGPRLRDLDSTNGTYVDGARTFDAYLRPGSVVLVGHASLQLEDGGRVVDEPLSRSECFGPLLGRSPAMRSLFAKLERAAASDVKVLIEGETGTGKELCARAIHETSPRRTGPFVVVDCGALAPGVLQSELFGHERGAFSGASARRIGQVEAADGGTLFLDEIGELPLELQPSFLRVLETGEVRRLGGDRAAKVDVRVVAATNRDLATEVNRGTFREDLFYRLAVARVELPPLRERGEDIPMLVEHFAHRVLERQPGRADDVMRRFSPAALSTLTEYRWPGNVRELRNVVERTLALDELRIDPPSFHQEISSSAEPEPSDEIRLDVLVDIERPMVEQRAELVERFERTYLEALMEQHEGKIAPASRASHIDRSYLRRLLKKYR